MVGRSVPEILEAVRHGLEHPLAQCEIRRDAAADLFYSPGSATDRAVAALYRILELEAPSPSVTGRYFRM